MQDRGSFAFWILKEGDGKKLRASRTERNRKRGKDGVKEKRNSERKARGAKKYDGGWWDDKLSEEDSLMLVVISPTDHGYYLSA